MPLPILQGIFPSSDIYSHALASAYHREYRIIDPDFSQEREPAVWELIQRDPVVQQAILQRLALVAPKTWQVEPATKDDDDKRLAEIIREVLEGISNFTQARADLAKGIFRGRSYAYIAGRRRPHRFESSTTARGWWLPRRLQPVDKRRIQFVPHREGDRIVVRVQLFSVVREAWEDIKLKGNFVSITYGGEEESRLGYGRGIIETLYFLWWARMRIIKEGLQAVERWSQGFMLAKVDSSSRPGAAGKSPDAIRDEMVSMLEKHRARHIAVVDATDDISLVAGPTGEHSLAEFWINYIDSKILGVALGAVLPFGGSEGVGSLARAMEEGDQADDRTELDRNIIDEAIQTDLIECFLRYNRGALADEGLGDARTPHFRTQTQKREDPKENAETAEVMLRSGAPIKREEYYARVGWEQPSEDDEVVVPIAPDGFGGTQGAVGSSLGVPDSLPDSYDPLDPELPTGDPGASEEGSEEEPAPETTTEAAVESELLGKVGGITGAIEILKSLDEGTVTTETAIRLFILFFQLSPEEARALIGESGQEIGTPDERSIQETEIDPSPSTGDPPREPVEG